MGKSVIHYDTGTISCTPLNVYKVALCGRWIHIKDKHKTTKNHPEITCKSCYKKWLGLANKGIK